MKKRFVKKRSGKRAGLTGLKVAAIFEAAKGILVLLVGFGLLNCVSCLLNCNVKQISRMKFGGMLCMQISK